MVWLHRQVAKSAAAKRVGPARLKPHLPWHVGTVRQRPNYSGQRGLATSRSWPPGPQTKIELPEVPEPPTSVQIFFKNYPARTGTIGAMIIRDPVHGLIHFEDPVLPVVREERV